MAKVLKKPTGDDATTQKPPKARVEGGLFKADPRREEIFAMYRDLGVTLR